LKSQQYQGVTCYGSSSSSTCCTAHAFFLCSLKACFH